jgi:hypothetical protein
VDLYSFGSRSTRHNINNGKFSINKSCNCKSCEEFENRVAKHDHISKNIFSPFEAKQVVFDNKYYWACNWYYVYVVCSIVLE